VVADVDEDELWDDGRGYGVVNGCLEEIGSKVIKDWD
jgi:hypothetical protein